EAIEGGTVKADVVYAELGELAAGLKEGRASAEEITIFKSVGVGLQDIAVAAALFGTAKRHRLGTPLDPFALSVPLAETDIDAQNSLNTAAAPAVQHAKA
ncbi:MAG TPA: hypothetical protein VHZ55_24075, partial [Bryobacteraceae bacterium]|nr:hypothetical protein [Bryobacteraceae bacterium]